MKEAIDALFQNGWGGTVERDVFGWNITLWHKETTGERVLVSGHFAKAKAAKRFVKAIVKVKVSKDV